MRAWSERLVGACHVASAMVVACGTVLAGNLASKSEFPNQAATLGRDVPAQPSAKTVQIRSIRLETAPTGTTVVIEGTGPLPDPQSDALGHPPRIYLDFSGVLPPSAVDSAASNSAVSRIRAAEHSASPLVTRVVLDLIKEIPYRLDVSAREQGRVLVVLNGAPVVESRTANARAPDTQYANKVEIALVRLQALRPTLEAIDRRSERVPGDLDSAAKELDDVARLLNAIKPPSTRASTHALMLRTCTLGVRALRLRQSVAAGQDATPWDAASAAAGALLMLDRASEDLRRK